MARGTQSPPQGEALESTSTPELSAEEVTSIGSTLGLAPLELADRLNVSLDEVRAWGSGERLCRGRDARRLLELAIDSDQIALFLIEKRHVDERYRPQLQVRRQPVDGYNASTWRGELESSGEWKRHAHGGFEDAEALVDYVTRHFGGVDLDHLREEIAELVEKQLSESGPSPFERGFEEPEDYQDDEDEASLVGMAAVPWAGRGWPNPRAASLHLVVMAILAVAAYWFVYHYLQPMLS